MVSKVLSGCAPAPFCTAQPTDAAGPAGVGLMTVRRRLSEPDAPQCHPACTASARRQTRHSVALCVCRRVGQFGIRTWPCRPGSKTARCQNQQDGVVPNLSWNRIQPGLRSAVSLENFVFHANFGTRRSASCVDSQLTLSLVPSPRSASGRCFVASASSPQRLAHSAPTIAEALLARARLSE